MATQMAIKRLTNDYKDLEDNPIANISVKVRITTKGPEVLKYPEIFSPLQCKKIRIGAIEIWVFLLFFPFIR